MDLDFDLECPECGAAMKATLDDIAKQRAVTCRRGHRVTLVDKGGGARQTQSALDSFERSLKRLGG